MANTVKLKKSAVPGKVPLASDLEYGELAINYADGVIYYKRSDNVVKSISAGGASLYFGEEPPNDPNSGDTWIDSATGVEYRYVNDGDSSQWVELGLSVAEGITPGGTTGQVLVKASNDDYDTEWVDINIPTQLSDFTNDTGFISESDASSLYLSLLGGALSGGLIVAKNSISASNIDLQNGNFFSKTISSSTTFTVSNIPSTGNAASFILDLTNAGSSVITWWSGVIWPGGTPPTLTSSGRDVLGFFTHDGGSTWVGLVLGKDIK